MVSATATFTIGQQQGQQLVSQSDYAPNPSVNTNSSLNYPTYVPVSVPAPVPGQEASITNVSMPQVVLPGSTFTITVTIKTYIAGTANYMVTLSIPQLSLNNQSPPITLSNLATGTTTFTVSLPVTPTAQLAQGVVTGQLNLINTTTNQTDAGTPLQFQIQGLSTQTPVGAVPLIPGALPGRLGHVAYSYDAKISYQATTPAPPQQGQAVLIAQKVGNTLRVDVHGLNPGEQADLDLNIPLANKNSHNVITADQGGSYTKTYTINKPAHKQYIAAAKITGHNSKRNATKTVPI